MKKEKKVKTVKKSRVEKTRNLNTQSESGFWGMIRATLRSRTRFWKPRLLALQNARRKYTGTNPKQKWEYKCAKCEQYFLQKDVEIHHAVAAGSLKCKEDLPQFVENLFAETGWICYCKVCHKLEHSKPETDG